MDIYREKAELREIIEDNSVRTVTIKIYIKKAKAFLEEEVSNERLHEKI